MKKANWKKVLCTILSILLIFSLTGCRESKDKDNNATQDLTTSNKEEETTAGSENNRNQPEWIDTAILYEVNIRQFTEEGTFKAFESSLERIRDMGVNALWFMPIHPISEEKKKGTLGSYYAVADYRGINSEFGTMEDFKELVNKAHEMGFKVIIDWVANHTGWDHEWITKHPDWYVWHNEEIITPDVEWTDVAQLNFENSELRATMIDEMKYWITETNIDGFRCDYAQGAPVDFWNEAREELNKVKEIFMLAEDGIKSNAMLVNAFDCNYNFDLYDLLLSIALGGKSAKELEYRISQDLPEGAFSMSFIENHDKNSWDGSMKDRFGEEPINALTTLIFTVEGMPLVYSGQEEDIVKTLEFFEKDQIPWNSYKYEGIIKRLCQIKLEYPALHNGKAGAKLNNISGDNRNVLAFERVKDGKKITVIINMSKEEQSVEIDYNLPKGGTILLHGIGAEDASYNDTAITADEISSLNTLKAWEYYVIASDVEE